MTAGFEEIDKGTSDCRTQQEILVYLRLVGARSIMIDSTLINAERENSSQRLPLLAIDTCATESLRFHCGIITVAQ